MKDNANHIAERFQKDTANHQMTVLHDDGTYRHLRFRQPGQNTFWFDLVTWPGSLTIRGDYGDAYTFSRVPDMFEFFRMHRTPRAGRLEINPHYWSQKVDGGRDLTTTYSQALFREHVIDAFKTAVEDGDAPRGLGKVIRTEILDDPDIDHEDFARKLVESFEYGTVYVGRCTNCRAQSATFTDRAEAKAWEIEHEEAHAAHVAYVGTEPAFTFEDTWEWDLRDYDWTFLWACHAIVWGIARYDEAKARTFRARTRRALRWLSPRRFVREAVAS